jgi:hypothetical protein
VNLDGTTETFTPKTDLEANFTSKLTAKYANPDVLVVKETIFYKGLLVEETILGQFRDTKYWRIEKSVEAEKHD